MEGSRRTSARQQSAIIQHAVHPPQGTASVKPVARQQPIPVCAVQPGRVLEMRTSLGLLRARQLLQQQVSSSDDEDEQTQHQAQRLVRNRAQLKSARLQPLGIVEDEFTSSQLCLGVVPARSSRCQRPRSSTTHGVQFDISGLQKKVPKGRRRSRSAILARTVDTEHLMKLLSVSKQTGFHPQNSPRDHNELSTVGGQSPSIPVVLTPLPRAPVVKYDGELGMKVEVRGLRQTEQHTAHSKNATELSPRRQKLPPIAKTSLPVKQIEPISSYKRSSSTPTTIITPRRPSTTEPIRVSIVSVGEAVLTEEQTRTRRQKRKSSARLSHGWSPPQTVEPITGSAMIGTSREHSPRSREGCVGEEDAPINSMLIKVNVNEYLDGN